jgi:hypothetical protein
MLPFVTTSTNFEAAFIGECRIESLLITQASSKHLIVRHSQHELAWLRFTACFTAC